MAKYKKTATVDAIQFLGQPLDGVSEEIQYVMTGHNSVDSIPVKFYYIQTLEGKMYGNIGDYVCTDVDGEKWFIKKDIFEKLYEKIDE